MADSSTTLHKPNTNPNFPNFFFNGRFFNNTSPPQHQMASLFVEQGAAMKTTISGFHIPPASMSSFDILSVAQPSFSSASDLAFAIFFFFFFFISSATSHSDFAVNGGLTDAEALYIKQRQLLYYRDEFGDRGEFVTVAPSLVFPNPRLRTAYIALQAWKEAIFSDPQNLTADWVGSRVCNYTGVFCAPAPDNSSILTVAGIDLNHSDITGYLAEELGLLTDLALFHINSKSPSEGRDLVAVKMVEIPLRFFSVI